MVWRGVAFGITLFITVWSCLKASFYVGSALFKSMHEIPPRKSALVRPLKHVSLKNILQRMGHKWHNSCLVFFVGWCFLPPSSPPKENIFCGTIVGCSLLMWRAGVVCSSWIYYGQIMANSWGNYEFVVKKLGSSSICVFILQWYYWDVCIC